MRAAILAPADISKMQDLVGNRAVQTALQGKFSLSPAVQRVPIEVAVEPVPAESSADVAAAVEVFQQIDPEPIGETTTLDVPGADLSEEDTEALSLAPSEAKLEAIETLEPSDLMEAGLVPDETPEGVADSEETQETLASDTPRDAGEFSDAAAHLNDLAPEEETSSDPTPSGRQGKFAGTREKAAAAKKKAAAAKVRAKEKAAAAKAAAKEKREMGDLAYADVPDAFASGATTVKAGIGATKAVTAGSGGADTGEYLTSNPDLVAPDSASSIVAGALGGLGSGAEMLAHIGNLASGLTDVADDTKKVKDRTIEGAGKAAKSGGGAVKAGARTVGSGALLAGNTALATGAMAVAAPAQIVQGGAELLRGVGGATMAQSRKTQLEALAETKSTDAPDVADAAKYSARVQGKKRNRRILNAVKGGLQLSGGALLVALGVSNPLGWLLTGGAALLGGGAWSLRTFKKWRSTKSRWKSEKWRSSEVKNEERFKMAEKMAKDLNKYKDVLKLLGFSQDAIDGKAISKLDSTSIYRQLKVRN